MDRAFDARRYLKVLDNKYPFTLKGVIKQAIGLTLEARGPKVSLGELCYAQTNRPNKEQVPCEVVGFKDDKILLMPLGDTEGLGPGSELFMTGKSLRVNVGLGLVGRVLNGLGELMDDGKRIEYQGAYPVLNTPPSPLSRTLITEALPVGVKAIDGLLTIGKGQRMGIFAGSGVGKSTLMGMIARNTAADVNVIALVGERGREVREFLENDLGPEGLSHSVVVVATSDQPALVRLKGAFVATSIAEFFRDQGKDVLLLMDSLTRLALAQREVGLAIGEPPTTRGYPPSVFALLPKLLERAGTSSQGTITGLYTVLVEGDDLNEPVTDTVRGIIDGHIILSRKIAARNLYPSVDVLSSVSRVMPQVVGEAQAECARQFRTVLANYEDARDLIDIGAYKDGANPRVDEAIRLIEPCTEFIRQGMHEKVDFPAALNAMYQIFAV
jgi:flagellum-specific ATP synthase